MIESDASSRADIPATSIAERGAFRYDASLASRARLARVNGKRCGTGAPFFAML